MKRTVLPDSTPEAWRAESLLRKAQRFAEEMAEHDGAEWQHALCSSLCLELLARAALSNVSPALLAENNERNWSSLFHALGFTPIEPKFSPRSISTVDVFRRLGGILQDFNKEIENFCILHIGRRNSELHSGETAFDGLIASSWHPHFYRACSVLLTSMDLTSEDLFGTEEAAIAVQLMAAADDDRAAAVRGDVDAHKRVWLGREKQERDSLNEAARTWATRQSGHRVRCPACESAGLVVGEPISAPQRKLEDDLIIEMQQYLPNKFECVACGLKILGLSRLSVVGLGDRYRKTDTYDAAEYYAPEPVAEDQWAGFEEDNNE